MDDRFLEQNKVGHHELNIIPELEAFLPRVSEDDAELEKDLIASAGPRDAICIWYAPETANHNVILDGHRRYAICRKHKLPFKITYVTGLKNMGEATTWMVRFQLLRRNMTPQERRVFVTNLYDKTAAEHPELPTAQTVAAMTGIAKKSVFGQVSRVRKVEALVTPLREAITHNKVKASERTIDEVFEMPPAEQHKVLQQALAGDGKLSSQLGGVEGYRDKRLERAEKNEVLEAAKRSLGRLYSDIQRLGKRVPNPVSLRSCENHINGMNSLLKNWET